MTSSKQWIHFLRSDLCPPTSNNLQGTKRMLNDVCCLGFYWIERKVTSCYHSSKISGSQQYFLIVMATSIVEQWKKRHGLPFCSLVQSCLGKSCMSMSIQKFCYHGDVTQQLLISILQIAHLNKTIQITYLKWSLLKSNCTSTMPVVLTLVLKRSCSVGS